MFKMGFQLMFCIGILILIYKKFKTIKKRIEDYKYEIKYNEYKREVELNYREYVSLSLAEMQRYSSMNGYKYLKIHDYTFIKQYLLNVMRTREYRVRLRTE